CAGADRPRTPALPARPRSRVAPRMECQEALEPSRVRTLGAVTVVSRSKLVTEPLEQVGWRREHRFCSVNSRRSFGFSCRAWLFCATRPSWAESPTPQTAVRAIVAVGRYGDWRARLRGGRRRAAWSAVAGVTWWTRPLHFGLPENPNSMRSWGKNRVI